MNTNTKPERPRNLDGITLEMIVTRLSEKIGWEAMGIAVPCAASRTTPASNPA